MIFYHVFQKIASKSYCKSYDNLCNSRAKKTFVCK